MARRLVWQLEISAHTCYYYKIRWKPQSSPTFPKASVMVEVEQCFDQGGKTHMQGVIRVHSWWTLTTVRSRESTASSVDTSCMFTMGEPYLSDIYVGSLIFNGSCGIEAPFLWWATRWISSGHSQMDVQDADAFMTEPRPEGRRPRWHKSTHRSLFTTVRNMLLLFLLWLSKYISGVSW